jgi:hypothetical protein
VNESRGNDQSLPAGAGHGSHANGSTVNSREEDACVEIAPPAVVGSSAQGHSSLITASTPTTSTLQDMVWKRVGCSYKAPGTDKVVLQDVWGCALSGEVQVGASQAFQTAPCTATCGHSHHAAMPHVA